MVTPSAVSNKLKQSIGKWLLQRSATSHTLSSNVSVSLLPAAGQQQCNSAATARRQFSLADAGKTGGDGASPIIQQPTVTGNVAVAASGASARSVIVKLLQNIGSKKEVEQYLKYYSSLETPRFAVIKVGGGVTDGEDLNVLAESLSFLSDVGLLPVVIHGGGPQLNAALEAQGIVSDYHDGIRVTTPAILRTARKIFLSANARIVRALEERGTRARPIVSGVFTAKYLDKEKFQYVGEVVNVNIDQVVAALELGQLPILSCMGETDDGQILNVNADVAGSVLAKVLKPVKVVYISQKGGLVDQHKQLMQTIDLETDYDRLMQESWFRYGDRLKLREIKQLLDNLPLSSSVAITSAQALPKELFTHKGSGTLIRRSEKIHTKASLQNVDRTKLTKLIETSFGGKLDPTYLDLIAPNIHKVIVTDSYNGLALVTLSKDSDQPAIPYLDKFAVTKLLQGEGTGQLLWNVLKRECKQLYWRSRASNQVNSWYFERAQGSYTEGEWTVFWYGLNSFEESQACIRSALGRKPSIDRSIKVTHDEFNTGESSEMLNSIPIRSAWASNSGGNSAGSPRQQRSFSTSVSSRSLHTMHTQSRRSFSTNKSTATRVGLIGARGHTGAELIRLIDLHPSMTLTVASSRQLVGKKVGEVFNKSTASGKFSDVEFVNLSPDDLPNRSDVDVWILALPNNLAAPYADKLKSSASKTKVVDLSADYRFDSSWQYGLPERHGMREAIKQATRISNPGCYATGAQFSLLPLASAGLIDSSSYTPSVFGVSGYSGAGTNPSRKNDPVALEGNLMPYTLLNHMHEREVSHQLKQSIPTGIRFMPHVAPWFRGITLTTAVTLSDKAEQVTVEDLLQIYQKYYDGERLVRVLKDIPEVQAIQNKHHVEVGGLAYNPQNKRLVICATIDNLLKGAATQAIQNINLMQGLDEYGGIEQ